MDINVRLFEEIRSLPLLKNCGLMTEFAFPRNSTPVNSWKAAQAAYTDSWSRTKDARYSDISLLLSQINRPLFNTTWSSLVAEGKRLISSIEIHVSEECSFSAKLRNYVKADLLCILIEETYSCIYEQFPNFYRLLYDFYQHGHFPCGWTDGEYPNGKFLFF